MVQQSNGKIFLAGERGHSEQDWFRSYSTFSFGAYQHPHKAHFGPLYGLNDLTLAGGKSFVQFVEEDSDVILIPTVGVVSYSDSTGSEALVEAGQVQRQTVRGGTTFEVTNPYEQALVNVIQLWIRHGDKAGKRSNQQVVSFNLEEKKDNLLQIIPPNKNAGLYRIAIGKFSGRQEAIYKTANAQNGIFLFVLEGAFEAQFRLLEQRDGLALWGTTEIELEALSNNAILLLIELTLAVN